MPAGNGTGPMGAGPMTGRGAGSCAGNSTQTNTNTGAFGGFGRGRGAGCRGGRGFGRGFGNGQGFRQGGVPNAGVPSAETELNVLKQQAQSLADAQKNILGRITELEKTEE